MKDNLIVEIVSAVKTADVDAHTVFMEASEAHYRKQFATKYAAVIKAMPKGFKETHFTTGYAEFVRVTYNHGKFNEIVLDMEKKADKTLTKLRNKSRAQDTKLNALRNRLYALSANDIFEAFDIDKKTYALKGLSKAEIALIRKTL